MSVYATAKGKDKRLRLLCVCAGLYPRWFEEASVKEAQIVLRRPDRTKLPNMRKFRKIITNLFVAAARPARHSCTHSALCTAERKTECRSMVSSLWDVGSL